METAIYLIGFLLLIALIIAVVSSGDPVPSTTEEVADEIMDELLVKEAPEPPPSDLFVREEDLVEVIEPTKEVEAELVAPDATDSVYEMEMPTEEPAPVVAPEVISEVLPEVKEEPKPVVANVVPQSEPTKKKKKHYPSKPRNKKS
jgi:outer membrane biosynthesis protein TonB